MQKPAPFSRVTGFARLLAAAMAMPAAFRQSAMAQIGTYESRGHGTGRWLGLSRNTVAQNKRAALKARNRARNKAAHRG
ncbi:hypothetical protein [Bordetella phage vB_BbrM_PHB04]|uniref:Uncharacterized protein n=1 Tax=Bordetella phage vB_BbrM_PHB04 TaxID=2029657 RepID=A0A291L9Z0_9CAUD|nr:hypothetical protein HOS14_gp087 [Bordetella phage vB_BbrM_PHB04]ATI15705.1 hypothetical protein [Bordetella phage vB_BbrM_PHB04]